MEQIKVNTTCEEDIDVIYPFVNSFSCDEPYIIPKGKAVRNGLYRGSVTIYDGRSVISHSARRCKDEKELRNGQIAFLEEVVSKCKEKINELKAMNDGSK